MDYATAKESYRAACKDYSEAANVMLEAGLLTIRVATLVAFPTATSLVLQGDYDEQMQLQVAIDGVHIGPEFIDSEDPRPEVRATVEGLAELQELVWDELLTVAYLTGEDYEGKTQLDLTST